LIGPLNNLACVYREQGRSADAAERLERALKIAEKAVGKTHVSLLPILANYASVLRKLDRVPEAQELERRADEIRATLNPELQRPESSYVI
jgi:tetratricopeptide (TPR) repeat protein